MISCQDALERIYEYLDGELEHAPEEEVRAHFEACRRCFPHLKLEESLRAAVKRACCGQEAPPELREHLMELLSRVDRG